MSSVKNNNNNNKKLCSTTIARVHDGVLYILMRWCESASNTSRAPPTLGPRAAQLPACLTSQEDETLVMLWQFCVLALITSYILVVMSRI